MGWSLGFSGLGMELGSNCESPLNGLPSGLKLLWKGNNVAVQFALIVINFNDKDNKPKKKD